MEQNDISHIDMSAIIAGLYPYAESGAYGFGWALATLKVGGTVVGHTGGIDGFSAEMAYWPQLGLGIVLLNNLEPAQGGALIYLNGGEDLAIPLARVEGAGGKIIMPKMSIGANGFMARFTDTEGNIVAFHSMK